MPVGAGQDDYGGNDTHHSSEGHIAGHIGRARYQPKILLIGIKKKTVSK